jgi:hypothetical protein
MTIYKKDTNFLDDFFIISILPLKKTTTKKGNQLCIKKKKIFGRTFFLFLFYP